MWKQDIHHLKQLREKKPVAKFCRVGYTNEHCKIKIEYLVSICYINALLATRKRCETL